MTFGDRLKEILEQREIRQKDFAQKVNISSSSLNGYVTNRRLPNILLVRDFASALGVSVDYLLDYQPSNDSLTVSPEETALIKSLRELPKEKRELVCSLVKMLSEN